MSLYVLTNHSHIEQNIFTGYKFFEMIKNMPVENLKDSLSNLGSTLRICQHFVVYSLLKFHSEILKNVFIYLTNTRIHEYIDNFFFIFHDRNVTQKYFVPSLRSEEFIFI